MNLPHKAEKLTYPHEYDTLEIQQNGKLAVGAAAWESELGLERYHNPDNACIHPERRLEIWLDAGPIFVERESLQIPSTYNPFAYQ
jgi:hypothetical protein